MITKNEKYTAYKKALDAKMAAEDALEALESALREMGNSNTAWEIAEMKSDLGFWTEHLNDYNFPRPKGYKAPQTWANEKSTGFTFPADWAKD